MATASPASVARSASQIPPERSPGFTGVIVSHDIPEVFKISDRVAMLANGVITESAATPDFVESNNPIVRQFLQFEAEGPMAVL